jgi:RNA polymerase sigma-70 factor (ECF subfamily)
MPKWPPGASAIGKRDRLTIQAPGPPDLEDGQARLIERAGRGDTTAFRALHARYYQRLYAYAHLRLGDREDARDAVQDVFLVVWRRLGSFQYHHDGSFPAWLFRIAANVVADRLRRSRRGPILLEELPDQGVEFEGRSLSRQVLVQSLRKLPEHQRDILILRFVLDMPIAAVARAVGKTEGAVTQLQLRGLQRLRRELGSV